MDICIDLTSLDKRLSGIERYAKSITQSLIRINQTDKFVLVFKNEIDPAFRELANRHNVEAVVIQNKRRYLTFSQVYLPFYLGRIKADCFVFPAFPAPLLFRKKSLSVIFDLVMIDCPDTMTWRSRWLWRSLYSQVSKRGTIVTISEFTKRRIVEHYKVDPTIIYVTYCGVDDRFSHNDGLCDGLQRYELPQKYMLALSTIEPRKNLPLLIEAWVQLWSEGEMHLDLVLAGKRGWKTAGIENLVPSELKSHFHFTGFIDDKDLPALYRRSSLFVSPSLYEGFGLPPVEARLSGAKVICSNIPCHQEICGSAVSYFDARSVDDLKKVILESLCEERTTESLPRNYSWDYSAEILYEAIKAHASEIKATRR